MKHPEEFKYYTLFLNNGNPNGFTNQVMYGNVLNEENHPKIVMLAYDLKNQFEQLSSNHTSGYRIDERIISSLGSIEQLSNEAIQQELSTWKEDAKSTIAIQARLSKKEYCDRVNAIKEHIHKGDVYEVNYCMEFFAEEAELNPYSFFATYNSLVEAPMTAFVKWNDLFVISCSPERFLKRDKNRLIAQPIKGTRSRGKTVSEDEMLKHELKNDIKERSENIMIVDLTRNDLSRIAKRGSVQVDELCEVHSFKNVHQSISTVSCSIDETTGFDEILKATFPMGSMTGAPKIRAMQLIEEYENVKRNLYSGSIGYLNQNGDFDLNVVIRTVFYDRSKKYLSFMVGGAITALSDTEKEYEECMIKANAILKALGVHKHE
jgi:para-aminobenzoate synthetase component 1